MTRAWLVGAALIAAAWSGVIVAQGLGDPLGRAERIALGVAALLAAGGHLLAAWAAGLRPGGRAVEVGPSWVAVQAERHRRLAARVAAWGLGLSVLALGLAWPGRVAPGWLLTLAAGVNLGLQPGLILAEGFSILARGRLVRSTGSPA